MTNTAHTILEIALGKALEREEKLKAELKKKDELLFAYESVKAPVNPYWIPVSEKLPEKEQKNSVMSKEVFVSDGREVWKARCVVSGKRWSYTNSPSATLPITHWKPIILP